MACLQSSCPIPDPSRPRPRHFYPLLGFVVPTLVMGYGVVIPRNDIAGLNELTIGFGSTVLGACVAYVMGLRSALRDVRRSPSDALPRGQHSWRRPLFLARQAARPTGPLGWLLGSIMAAETARDNEGTLAYLALKPTDHVLEVGCGHGRTIWRAAAATPNGRVVGLDPSPTMVRMAHRRNHAAVTQGRVRLDQGDAASLPYADASFDKVCATHTLYFWTDLERVARELGRVLKHDGRLVLGFGDDGDMRHAFPSQVYTLRSPNDVRAALQHAGFTQVRVESSVCGARSMHWAIAESWTPRDQV